MPQSKQHHGDDQRQVAPPHFAPQGRERKKYIIANPERQRHVPSRPENRGTGGVKRTSEVFRHRKAQSPGGADGNVRVSRKIEEQLQSISESEAPRVGTTPPGDAIET